MDLSSNPNHLDPQELIKRGLCPVKSQYIRIFTSRPKNDDPKPKPQSRRAARKAKKRTHSAVRLCFDFIEGKCHRGTDCKYAHDFTEYAAMKPADLPGICPMRDACLFGARCRFALSHAALLDEHRKALESNVDKGEEEEEPVDNQEALELLGGVSFDRDDSIPREPIVSLFPAELNYKASHQQEANHMTSALKTSLKRNEYNFEKADALLTKMGIPIKFNAHKRNKAPRGGGGGAAPVAAPAPAVDPSAAAPTTDPTTAPTVTLPSQAPPTTTDASPRESSPPLNPREKRTIDFSDKLYLAPLTTNGNLPFRRLCKTLGADVTCGEMALATSLVNGLPQEWALVQRHPSEDLFGVQICGGFPDSMARCAQLLEDQVHVDFVDLNFGCPIDLVCSKGGGSSMLKNPRRMESICRATSSLLSCPLTIKIRKGFDKGEDNVHTWLPHVREWGVAAVTLHGRTREQRYSKTADWDYIAQCAAVSSVPLLGNGDIFSYLDYERDIACGVKSVMIGRGALIKPWLFQEIKERRHWDISATERFDLMKDFCRFGLDHWGSDDRGVETTRRFFLEMLSFTHRYVPVGLLEVLPQTMTQRPPAFLGRNVLETWLGSDKGEDWVRLSEMLLGPAPDGFVFSPKHKTNSYTVSERDLQEALGAVEAVDGEENG